jgi:hypothetical protein
LFGLTSKAITAALGTSPCSKSSRFAPSARPNWVMPVTLPPGPDQRRRRHPRGIAGRSAVPAGSKHGRGGARAAPHAFRVTPPQPAPCHCHCTLTWAGGRPREVRQDPGDHEAKARRAEQILTAL